MKFSLFQYLPRHTPSMHALNPPGQSPTTVQGGIPAQNAHIQLYYIFNIAIPVKQTRQDYIKPF